MEPLTKEQCLQAIEAMVSLKLDQRCDLDNYLHWYTLKKAARDVQGTQEIIQGIAELLWPKLFIGELHEGPLR